MSKVASITISAKSPLRSSNSTSSEWDKPRQPDIMVITSDSEEEKFTRRRKSSSGTHSSPDRRRVVENQPKVYDEERGLINSQRSGRMSARQRTLEKELNTEDPMLVATHDEAVAASSDDGLEDVFVHREAKHTDGTYTMVKESTRSEEGGSIYDKKNVDAPRLKSEPAGNRVRSATGKLMDNYVKDQSFDNLSEDEKVAAEKPQKPFSILKSAYVNQANGGKTRERSKIDLELEEIRTSFRNQGMMDNSDSGGEDRNPPQEHEVLYRKPLKNIKSRFLAAASGHKVASSSDSDGETTEEKETEEILKPPTRVVDMKQKWQVKQDWRDEQKVDAKEDIDVAQVCSARVAFKQMESKKDAPSAVNRPRIRVRDPQSLMEKRRHQTYGDDPEEVDGIVTHMGLEELSTVRINTNQIKAARKGYESLEESKREKKAFVKKPSMKLIKQDEVKRTMADHRKKVTGDEDELEEMVNRHLQTNGHVTNGDHELQQ